MRSAVAKEMEKLALQTTKYYKKFLLYTQRVGVVCDVCTSQPHLASPPHHTTFTVYSFTYSPWFSARI